MPKTRKTGTPIVSTVIPAYNSERTLVAAIESVLGQDVPGCELIVIDDGSIDATPKILRRHGRRIRWVRQRNQGVSAARNLGIRMSRGRYIAFLDADDRWLPGKLRHQIDVLEHRPRVMAVSTGVRYLDEEGRTIRVRSREKEGWVFEDLLEGNYIVTSSLMLKKESLDGIPDPLFPLGIFYGEDYALWLKLAARHRLYETPRILVDFTLPSDRSFLRKYSEAEMRHSYETIFREVLPFGGPSALRKLRSRLSLELAGFSARRGDVPGTLERCLSAFRLRPWSPSAIPWYLETVKALARNLGTGKHPEDRR